MVSVDKLFALLQVSVGVSKGKASSYIGVEHFFNNSFILLALELLRALLLPLRVAAMAKQAGWPVLAAHAGVDEEAGLAVPHRVADRAYSRDPRR
eukprot:CAMPEP_0170210576 /NCGR_PEP_ID=MMETSP0116_2-20130129/4895_1 /TAXON_ID=400756 /ORGANISM="Durinskia baltica, Strain CSIRO CS-38" /LENGTH=94 /DNA_ID=CAMNT_0010461093 /DNA_START=240 /DNA_END=524 /DNA_ORIENTATION=+